MKRYQVAFALTLTTTLMCATTASFAGDNNGETAEALFEQGRTLVFQKKFAEACPKLAQSLKLDPGLGTRLWLADCYEKNGQTASAWKQFQQAASAAAERKDEREQVAIRRAAALESKLSRMLIVVAARDQASGIEVRCDGRVVASGDLGVPKAVDPGFHTIAATAPNREAWSATIEVPARPDSVTVNVPILQTAPKTIAAATAAPPPTTIEPAKDAPTTTKPFVPTTEAPVAYWSGLRIGAVTAGVVGLAAIGGSAFLGLRAKSQYDSSFEGDHCTSANACDATGKSRRDDAGSTATLATIAFGAGAAAIGTGVVLWLLAPSMKSETTITPTVGFRDAGLSLTRRW